MKLRTRLAVSSALVTLAVAVAVGAYAIAVSSGNEVQRVDASLAAGVRAVAADKGSPLAEALLFVKQDPTVVVLALVDADRQLTVLIGAKDAMPRSIQPQTLRDAITEPATLMEQETRIRTVPLADQEFVVLGASVRAINEFRVRNTRLLIQFGLLAALLGGAIITIVTRLDLRRVERMIDVAGAVAAGAEDVRVPPARGSSEVAELSRVLDQMVSTLRENAAREREMRVRMQEFVADASHELRTPLTVISGYLELLQAQQEDVAPAQRHRALDRMNQEAGRMRSLVSDLLLLAEVGSLSQPRFDDVDLSMLVDDAIHDLRLLNPDRSVDALVAPVVVMSGVRAHLEQLVANIFSNITRHTPADAAVRVRLWRHEREAFLRVEDAGPGLPDMGPEGLDGDDVREFTRFDQSRSRDTGGSGLGMSILAAIVREHQGSLKLSRSEIGGLRLDIKLSLDAPAAEATASEHDPLPQGL